MRAQNPLAIGRSAATGGITLLTSLLLGGLAAASSPDPRRGVLETLGAELTRSKAELKLADHQAPYFIGYRLVERRSAAVTARFGAVYSDREEHTRRVAVDVRVGDYRFDSSPDPDALMFFDSDPGAFQASAEAPLDPDPMALRGTLWLLTDAHYKEALSGFLKKRARKVNQVPKDTPASFSKEPPVQWIAPGVALRADTKRWAAIARRISARFRRDPLIIDGTTRLAGNRITTYIVNSEGTRLIKEHLLYTVSLSVISRASDGMLLDHGETVYAREANRLPSAEALEKVADRLIADLVALRAAPVIDPFTGPAILEAEATGVLFHETVGHRLEGERQKDENEGRTFVGQLGRRVLPTFLSVRDDPGQAVFESTELNGYYPFDDQGVRVGNTVLVEAGILKTFLMSRSPVKGASSSNGHGRAQGTRRPVARMGNLIIESSKVVPHARLRRLLLEQARAQGKPYGLIIRDITGGSTNTSNYGYQAFKGSPRLVYRVDAKTGEETLVRGVEMVGTPLTVINKIIATSDSRAVFNGFCGAESGYVPVSTVAPATLLSEIELQRTQRAKAREPALPPPWRLPPGGRPADR